MKTPQDKRRFIWVIDDADSIIHVNDAWLAFAQENDAPELTEDRVLNHSLWSFIVGQDTSYIYKQIFDRVRKGTKSPVIPFRCDAPDRRRFMEMHLSLLPDNAIQFLAVILHQEPRQSVDFLGTPVDRSGELVEICSWCKKVFIPELGWRELEEAIEPLNLFEPGSMPRMTHTICPTCYDSLEQELGLTYMP